MRPQDQEKEAGMRAAAESYAPSTLIGPGQRAIFAELGARFGLTFGSRK